MIHNDTRGILDRDTDTGLLKRDQKSGGFNRFIRHNITPRLQNQQPGNTAQAFSVPASVQSLNRPAVISNLIRNGMPNDIT